MHRMQFVLDEVRILRDEEAIPFYLIYLCLIDEEYVTNF